MIYDCFTFYNELDILEIRLNELNDVVDKFVIVEATKTFQFNRKPLFYAENKQRFKKFEKKIIHVVVDKYPTWWSKLRKPTAWDYEYNQRNQILKGLKKCRQDDIILISDVDEIPKADKIFDNKNTSKIIIFEHILYQFRYNFKLSESNVSYPLVQRNDGIYINGLIMLPYKKITRPQFIRNIIFKDHDENEVKKELNGGWHFSFIGDTKHIINKLQSFAHMEFNTEYYKDENRIEEALRHNKDIFNMGIKYKVIFIDDSADFPKYLKNNIEKYRKFIF